MKQDAILMEPRGGTTMPRARARFLAQAIQLEEDGPSHFITFAIYVSVALIASMIVWAAVTDVAEVAVTRGEVVPAGDIHSVQHLEGGIVNRIAVRDGDWVEQGQVLMGLAPPATHSELQQMQVRRSGLALEAERLRALIASRVPDFDQAGTGYPGLADQQRTLFEAQRHSAEAELEVIDTQIRQRGLELDRQANQVESLEREVDLLTRQVAMRNSLVEDNMVSESELLQTQSDLAETDGELREARDGIGVARSSLEEARQRRHELLARLNRDYEQELGTVVRELAEVSYSLVRLQDRFERLQLRAPVTGIVQGMTVTSINAVVAPGEVILQIVPVEDEMVVEARVSPDEIGHVHPGQIAEVKIDSYDSARFGAVNGEVRSLSASTYLDDDRMPYYRAEIGLEKSHVGEQADVYRILPGMTVQADIRTGSKSVLDYLLKPVSRGFQTAFQER